MAKSLKELAASRQAWINISRENRFEEGIKKLLTELYPDNAHFIYELLQNAEDAGAKTVRFKLATDHLVFEHDGERLFSLADVESITNIGSSTKSDDKTAIGKFGVGFKAVFAYTNSPEIHSGEFHFRLHDLVVPTTDGVNQESLGHSITRFFFPFDHPAKGRDKAVSEIEEGLQNLDDNTLLFLNNIIHLEYILPNGKIYSLERVEHDNRRIEIKFQDEDGKDISSNWLRFQKDVHVNDEDGKETECRIAIAYSLQQQEGKKQQPVWGIAPLERGQVAIYFPAEKETSNLRFHLHAPFASTVARDSVRDCAANRALRDELAKLVVESLFFIRDEDLLNVAFFAVLPNPSDNLPRFYEPIRIAIVTAFQNEKLTPTKTGSHAPATKLYRGPARISEIITDNDLSLLTGYNPPIWAANPPQLHQREDRFLDSLKIKVWGLKDLSCIFDNLNNKYIIEKLIKEKTDYELMNLYSLFGEAYKDTIENHLNGMNSYFRYRQNSNFHNNLKINIKYIHIIRVYNGQCDIHVLPEEAFFPSDTEILSEGINFVKPTLYQKEYAQNFLRYIGVRLFDQKVVVERLLKTYNSDKRSIGDWHFSDIKQFIEYWKRTGDIDTFKNCHYSFLLGLSPDGTTCWCRYDILCIDDPYIHTGLGNDKLQNIHKLCIVSPEYKEQLSEEQLTVFVKFIEKLGIMKWINIEETDCSNNPNRNNLLYFGGSWSILYGIDRDYSISNIELYISSCSIDASLLLWNTLIHANREVKFATYQRNSQRPRRTEESQLIYYLRTNAWIPDRSGIFRKPEDMTRDELQDDFIYDDRNGLLTAICFGRAAKERELAREQDNDYQRRNENAQELGFSSMDEAQQGKEIIQELKEQGQDPESFLRELKDRKKPIAFPERPVSDPEHREERFRRQFEDAPKKTSETRQRTVRTSKSAIDPTTWLRHNYTNDDDQMVCQICKQEMPFKKRDGAPYFESREIFAGKKGKKYLSKEHEAQYLALCPVCAAKYKEFVQNDEQAMATLKAAFLATDDLEIPITLGEERTTIRFVEKHLLDFRTILKTEK